MLLFEEGGGDQSDFLKFLGASRGWEQDTVQELLWWIPMGGPRRVFVEFLGEDIDIVQYCDRALRGCWKRSELL